MSKQEKMLALVKGYKDSGLSGAAYSRKHGIDRSRLYYWIKKLNQTDSPSGFVQIKPYEWLKYTLENIMTINHKNIKDLYPQNYKKMIAAKQYGLFFTLQYVVGGVDTS